MHTYIIHIIHTHIHKHQKHVYSYVKRTTYMRIHIRQETTMRNNMGAFQAPWAAGDDERVSRQGPSDLICIQFVFCKTKCNLLESYHTQPIADKMAQNLEIISKNIQLGVPGFLLDSWLVLLPCYYLVLIIHVMSQILVRWQSFRNTLKIWCHRICDWLYDLSHVWDWLRKRRASVAPRFSCHRIISHMIWVMSHMIYMIWSHIMYDLWFRVMSRMTLYKIWSHITYVFFRHVTYVQHERHASVTPRFSCVGSQISYDCVISHMIDVKGERVFAPNLFYSVRHITRNVSHKTYVTQERLASVAPRVLYLGVMSRMIWSMSHMSRRNDLCMRAGRRTLRSWLPGMGGGGGLKRGSQATDVEAESQQEQEAETTQWIS